MSQRRPARVHMDPHEPRLTAVSLTDIHSSVAPEPKTESFMVRMSPTERRMLSALAEQAGESDAAIVRRLVRAAHAELAPQPKPKKRRIRL